MRASVKAAKSAFVFLATITDKTEPSFDCGVLQQMKGKIILSTEMAYQVAVVD